MICVFWKGDGGTRDACAFFSFYGYTIVRSVDRLNTFASSLFYYIGYFSAIHVFELLS